jgi:peptidoglycan hydrolase-like protein with peptidoglycan-binding domain
MPETLELRVKDKSRLVVELQQLLLAKGGIIKVDGIFGDRTFKAVMKFQSQNSLPVDGIVGPITWKALIKAEETSDVPYKTWGSAPESHIRTVDGTFSMEDSADYLNVEIEAIKAVAKVESSGSGFLSDGRPKILFEGHKFWKQLIKHKINPEEWIHNQYKDVLYRVWTRKYYLGGAKEYTRLNKAKIIHPGAAMESASWGAFQILGLHWDMLGYGSINHFVAEMQRNEGEHLKAFVLYIQKNHLSHWLGKKNWVAFANAYNGPAFRQNNYHTKMKEAYESFVLNKVEPR